MLEPGTIVQVRYPAHWRGWWAIEGVDRNCGEVVDMSHKVVLSESDLERICYVQLVDRPYPEPFALELLKVIKPAPTTAMERK